LQKGFDQFLREHKYLLDEIETSNSSRRFPLWIPDLSNERAIDTAWIDIPSDFADKGLAKISLPEKYILKIPHIENHGNLCIDGDPGPLSGCSPEERIEQIIDLFYSSFIEPWSRGDLDDHFAKEAMNYWAIHYSRYLTSTQPVVKIYTTDHKVDLPRVYKSPYIESIRIVIAGNDSSIRNRYVNAISCGSNISSVMVCEIPISFPFTPETWPKNLKDIQRLIKAKLGSIDADKYLESVGRKKRSIHKIVVFRAADCSFGYLLPDGPALKIKKGYSNKSFPSKRLIPLKVERLDVSWTTGRDQHPEYLDRQQKHALIIGAGALGSPVAEQLAKSGIGKLTLVDGDTLNSANIGRHTLGADSIGFYKVERLAESIAVRWVSCDAHGFSMSIQQWLKNHTLRNIDIILDLTGEPSVRLIVNQERKKYKVNLLIGWMEPYAASAHACILPTDNFWITDNIDRLNSLNVVDWPNEVIVNEPACSSSFQCYTSASASHAVALITEAALDVIDLKVVHPIVRHWIRGQNYLDKCYPGLKLKQWASFARDYDGIITEFDFE